MGFIKKKLHQEKNISKFLELPQKMFFVLSNQKIQEGHREKKKTYSKYLTKKSKMFHERKIVAKIEA